MYILNVLITLPFVANDLRATLVVQKQKHHEKAEPNAGYYLHIVTTCR